MMKWGKMGAVCVKRFSILCPIFLCKTLNCIDIENSGKIIICKVHKVVEDKRIMKNTIKILSTSFPHRKLAKMVKNKSFTPSYPHYPHEWMWIVWIIIVKKRTNVLVSYNKNLHLSKKNKKLVDFWKF